MRKIFLIASFLSVLIIGTTQVKAEPTASITVTVTIPSTVSVSVSPTSWGIGNVALGETRATAEDYFTATNDGNVAEDFTIVCGNSENWTCGSVAGNEVFEMKAKGGDLGSWTDISTSKTLKENVPQDGAVNFGLQFKAPTSTSYVDTQQTITITITASKN